MKKRSWNDLSGFQQAAIAFMAFVQIGLLAAALWDLAHRKPEEVRGPRAMWAALSFIDFIGPIAYFTVGRKGGCCLSGSEDGGGATVTLEGSGNGGSGSGPA
jgi:hypothetical protein